MKKTKIIFLIFCSLQLLSCDTIKTGLGLEKNAPNEFLVEKRKSILLPPDYDLLEPGSKKEITQSNKEQDLKAVLNKELSATIKSDPEIKNNNIRSQSKEIEDKILINIK